MTRLKNSQQMKMINVEEAVNVVRNLTSTNFSDDIDDDTESDTDCDSHGH